MYQGHVCFTPDIRLGLIRPGQSHESDELYMAEDDIQNIIDRFNTVLRKVFKSFSEKLSTGNEYDIYFSSLRGCASAIDGTSNRS